MTIAVELEGFEVSIKATGATVLYAVYPRYAEYSPVVGKDMSDGCLTQGLELPIP